MKNNFYKEINLQNLAFNANFFKQQLKNSKLYSVVKANAYGHGLKQCVLTLNQISDGFCVVNNSEAIKVKKYTKKPVVVIGALLPTKLFNAIKNDVEFCVQSLFDVKMLEKYTKKLKKVCNIHIKIDTGMHRLGIHTHRELKRIVNFVNKSPYLAIAGICTHMGGNDSNNLHRTKSQFIKFNNLIDRCGLNNIPTHIANTETFLSNNIYGLNFARIGIGMYGYGHNELKPVMSVYAKILNISHIKKDEIIGYGCKNIAKKDLKIAVLNIGYAQGLMRDYYKKGYVLINGKRAKIVANICMDMTIVDISNIKNVKIGNYAVILGKSKNKQITALDIAQKCKTIEYEVLTNFNLINCTKYINQT